MTRRRYVAKQVKNGAVKLTRSLEFLEGAKFHSVIEEKSADSKRKWFIELTPKQFKALLEAEKRCEVSDAERETFRQTIWEKDVRLSRLEEQVLAMTHDKEVLVRQHNNFQKKVVEENGRIRIPKSGKNYLEVAEEFGTNFGRPAIQGGLAGLEKK